MSKKLLLPVREVAQRAISERAARIASVGLEGLLPPLHAHRASGAADSGNTDARGGETAADRTLRRDGASLRLRSEQPVVTAPYRRAPFTRFPQLECQVLAMPTGVAFRHAPKAGATQAKRKQGFS